MSGPVDDIVQTLARRGVTVATAESLTGGLLAARFTELPGSSDIYLGGIVSYATRVKSSVLEVDSAIIDEHGVVSAECAVEMAEGARRIIGSTHALSTTGVAGPTRQEDKPVGTVFIGLAGPAGSRAIELDLDGERNEIQAATVEAAVDALLASAGRPAEDPSVG